MKAPVINIANITITLPTGTSPVHIISQALKDSDIVHTLKKSAAVPDTITDSATGLMWSSATTAKDKMWDEAKQAASEVCLGGFTDWRLPTIKELLTLVDYNRTDPAIDPSFECSSSYYWSSTPDAASPSGLAWVVSFLDGLSDRGNQDGQARVRAVRSVVVPASGQ